MNALIYCLCSLVLLANLPYVASAAVAYTYDARMRLTRAAYDNGVAMEYTYDATDNRLMKTNTGPSSQTYEDGEGAGTTGWDIYDSDPTGATISKVFNATRNSNVVQFAGSGTANGYRLRKAGGAYWHDTSFKVIEWSMNYSESFTVYIAVQTKNGFRYLTYNPVNSDTLGNDTYISYGLGANIQNGQWHSVYRDLAYDIKHAQPDNELQAILGFLIRGNGMVDDIKTRDALPTTLDTDGDGLTDMQEMATYVTNPYQRDTDGDGFADKEEADFWGANWDSDPDHDGLINLLDPDADNDGIKDGVERSQGTNPADASSVPVVIVYEDAETGDIAGWDIYDNDPAGAAITNVTDAQRGSRVIQFTGSATANGYRLRSPDGSDWNETAYKVMEWSMNYTEAFVVYIPVQTKNGFRYLYYTAADSDLLGDSTYIHHGLGSYMTDGHWRVVFRDLAYDLKQAQPDNELQAVLGFLIRGNGKVDDIKIRAAFSATLDTDDDGLTDLEEMTIYGSNPYYIDSDGDGIDDKDELTFWGASWNADPDQDGLINLLDSDADNDIFNDGIERSQGTDPANAASVPNAITYENGEGASIIGWDIYDNNPAGATITKVYDNERASNVVLFTGSDTNNGYRLRQPNGNYWNDTFFKSIEWSMRYSEPFVVYIAVQTKNGFRYIYYTSAATSALGDSTYVHHGLGAALHDGNWHTLVRNLEQDLKEAQPDNELQSILGFLIRGSGKVDDVQTR